MSANAFSKWMWVIHFPLSIKTSCALKFMAKHVQSSSIIKTQKTSFSHKFPYTHTHTTLTAGPFDIHNDNSIWNLRVAKL